MPDADGLADLTEVMNDLVIRHAPKRTQFSIPLKFGVGDIEIGVSGYALISSQGKGTAEICPHARSNYRRGHHQIRIYFSGNGSTISSSQETGAVLRDEEIDHAFKFGNDSTVPNILERNWWETDEAAEEARAVADEMLRIDREHRVKMEDGEEEEEEQEEPEEHQEEPKKSAAHVNDSKRVVAKTRVGQIFLLK